MRCDACKEREAIAHVVVNRDVWGGWTKFLLHGHVCGSCLRKACQALGWGFPVGLKDDAPGGIKGGKELDDA